MPLVREAAMALTMGAVLALLGIAVALYPFVRHRFYQQPLGDAVGNPVETTGEPGTSSTDDLDAVYEAIRTLQLERELGSIPEGLFREQLNSYRIQAATLLMALEQEQEEGQGWALEEEIKMARAGLRTSPRNGIVCTNCGKDVPAGVDACPECGVASAVRSEC